MQMIITLAIIIQLSHRPRMAASIPPNTCVMTVCSQPAVCLIGCKQPGSDRCPCGGL